MDVEDRYIALLRGINVGTARRVRMADLRELAEAPRARLLTGEFVRSES